MGIELDQIHVFQLLKAVVMGILLGGVYFGGLKVTVNRMKTSRHPAVLVIVSYLSRLLLIFGGLVLLYTQSGLWGLLLGAGTALCMMLPFMFVMRRDEEVSS